MALVSRNKVDDRILEKLFAMLFEIVGNADDRDDFDAILQSILSSTEKIMIAKRIAIFYLLIKEVDYRVICKTLKVSAATVFKFRSIFENNDSVKGGIEAIIGKDKLKEIFEEIYLIMRGHGVPGVNWSGALKHKRDFERRKAQGI